MESLLERERRQREIERERKRRRGREGEEEKQNGLKDKILAMNIKSFSDACNLFETFRIQPKTSDTLWYRPLDPGPIFSDRPICTYLREIQGGFYWSVKNDVTTRSRPIALGGSAHDLQAFSPARSDPVSLGPRYTGVPSSRSHYTRIQRTMTN
ncbi:unnamed protein product, partial [Brenthis ino]